MSPKKQKKRRKIARREATAASVPKVTPRPATDEPVLPDPPAAEVRQEVTATFQVDQKRGPDGIDEHVAALEYPAVRRDLRKLGVTILVFALILGGLTLLASQTTVLDVLGDKLFKLWE